MEYTFFMKQQNYKELIIWQKSMKLTKDVYSLCESLSKHEKYGLTSQLQRAAVSIPSNIAEGLQRASDKEFLRFLSIAKGSSAELETQLILVKDIYGIDTGALQVEIDEIQRMIQALKNKLMS